MNSEYDDTFALQRLYEKWVVKEEWLLDEEAIPLLLGADPTTDFLNSEYRQLQIKVHAAISEGSLQTLDSKGEDDVKHKVKPAGVYQWAMTNRLSLPMELVNLMEFVLKTVLSTQSDSSSEDETSLLSYRSDGQALLGACFAIVTTFPDECKNSRGVIKTERVLRLLDEHSARLFNGQLPALSSTAIRDLVNHWLLKLR